LALLHGEAAPHFASLNAGYRQMACHDLRQSKLIAK
jgi:hypothetical protein